MLEQMVQSDSSQIVSDPAFQGFLAQFAGMSLDSALLALNYFLQALSAPVRINAMLNGVYEVESEFTVRYNRLLRWLPGVFVNRNPVINFVGIHKVKNPQPAKLDVTQMGERDSTCVLFVRGPLDPSMAARPFPAARFCSIPDTPTMLQSTAGICSAPISAIRNHEKRYHRP